MDEEKENRRIAMNRTFTSASLFAAAFVATTAAGVINVVQLGPPDVIRFEVKCGGASQPFDLPFGGSTGGFVLPEKEAAVITLPNRKSDDLSIPATAAPNIAVLAATADGKDKWTLIPGKPSGDKWSLRIVNLAGETAVIESAGMPLEIAAGATVEMPAKGKGDIAVIPKGGEKSSYDGKEPCAVVALLYPKDGVWKVLFVPDR